MRYSPSENGFYPDEIDYGARLPADVVPISDAQYRVLLAEQSAGKVIQPSQSGQPEAALTPVDQAAARRAMVLTRAQLFKGLRDAGIITAAQAVAASNQGVIPPALEASISQMPEPYQSDVRMDFGAFQLAHRDNPLVSMMAALNQPPLDAAWVDNFFLTCMAEGG